MGQEMRASFAVFLVFCMTMYFYEEQGPLAFSSVAVRIHFGTASPRRSFLLCTCITFLTIFQYLCLRLLCPHTGVESEWCGGVLLSCSLQMLLLFPGCCKAMSASESSFRDRLPASTFSWHAPLVSTLLSASDKCEIWSAA